MSSTPAEGGPPIESAAELLELFRAAEKPPEAWRVGMEHEKIGLCRESLARVPYDGDPGIREFLEQIAATEGWKPILEHGSPIALERDGASITLEPGGQIELSGAPLRSIHEICREFHDHLGLIKRVSEPAGIVWLGLGLDPIHDVGEVPKVPKERYRIMRSYLPTRGELALHMMHLTATVQANYDFESEADMAAKMRTAMAVTPIVSAIFANSSLSLGKPSGFISRRVAIWRDVDPDRCGLLHFVFEPDFGYARYLDWALDVPVFFILRDGRYLPLGRKTFRQFLTDGHEGHRATQADFRLHLTTVFPEVRLKGVIEVRGADAVPAGLTCSLPALWKGLLYDAQACAAAFGLAEGWDRATREAALRAVAVRGLAAEVAGRPVLDLARELVTIASEGLRRTAPAGSHADERGFLDPILAQLEEGKSPGQVVLERWEGEWGRSFQRLIEYARY